MNEQSAETLAREVYEQAKSPCSHEVIPLIKQAILRAVEQAEKEKKELEAVISEAGITIGTDGRVEVDIDDGQKWVNRASLERLEQRVKELEADKARLCEDRLRFPDRPDDVGRMIEANLENIKHLATVHEQNWRSETIRTGALSNENERLKAELELAKKDSERLDWLESQLDNSYLTLAHHPYRSQVTYNPEKWSADKPFTIGDIDYNWGATLRQAIDAARNKGGK